MGKKSVVFANGDLMLFRAVMDNRLAWLLEKHSENVSQKVILCSASVSFHQSLCTRSNFTPSLTFPPVMIRLMVAAEACASGHIYAPPRSS